MVKVKSRHGHYSNIFEEEAKRIKQMYMEILNIDITWTEATSIAAMRSSTTFWNDKKLKEILASLRGIF